MTRIADLTTRIRLNLLASDYVEVEVPGGLNYKATLDSIRPIINIKDYGAAGTGEDASAAALAAATAANDASGGKGGLVSIPAGDYIIKDAPISMGAGAPITYIGDGAGATNITTPANNSSFVWLQETNICRGGGMRSMTITGDGDSVFTTSSTTADSWNLTSTTHALKISKTSAPTDWTSLQVFDTLVSDCDLVNHNVGIRVEGRCRSPRFHNNNIWHCYIAALVPEHAHFTGENDLRHNWMAIAGKGSAQSSIFDMSIKGVKMLYGHYGIGNEDLTGISNCTIAGSMLFANRFAGAILKDSNTLSTDYIVAAPATQGYTCADGILNVGRSNLIGNSTFESFGTKFTNAAINNDPLSSPMMLVDIVGNNFTGRTGGNAVGLSILFSNTAGSVTFLHANITGNNAAATNGNDVHFVEGLAKVSYSNISNNVIAGNGVDGVGSGDIIKLTDDSTNNSVTTNNVRFSGAAAGIAYLFNGGAANSVFTGNIVNGGNSAARGFNLVNSNTETVYEDNVQSVL